SHTTFIREPALFFDYYKHNLVYADAQPNNAHKALAALEAVGKLKAVVTQNVDGLHQLAGSKVVDELHGSVLRNYCVSCGETYDLDYIMDAAHCIDQNGVQTGIPYCEKCGGVVRPDVVLYEEGLDERVVSHTIAAISAADVLLVGGTSLVVYPAAGFLRYFRGSRLVLINKSETSVDGQADLIIHAPIGEVLSEFL
ncbi:MAG: NAD-dependent protein deacylase, partial [Clostridiales Family XIII bacterium]|nr:NAD-dependent protein deacylase [Clostridiales Family XIII bacterium]